MTHSARSMALIAAAAASFAFALPPGATAEDADAPRDEAVRATGPRLVELRAVKSAESKEITSAARAALDSLRPFAPRERKSLAAEAGKTPEGGAIAFRAAWNDAICLSTYHGNKPVDEFLMRRTSVCFNRLEIEYPVDAGWTASGDRIQRKSPNDELLSEVSVQRFSFTYNWILPSGDVIDGENCRGLAEAFLDHERDLIAKVTKRSARVQAKAIGPNLGRMDHYEILGTTAEDREIRVRAWMFKDADATYRILAVEHRTPSEKDSPYVAWLRAGNDPQLDAVLQSAREKKKSR